MIDVCLGWLARSTALAVLVTLAAGCDVNLNTEGFTSRETRTFSVSGQPDVTLETFDGSIEIHSWDRNEIEVGIEKRAMDQSLIEQMTVEAEQQGDRIVLRVKGPARQDSRGVTIGVHVSPSARLLVAVPRKSVLSARTGDGSIRVEDIEGKLTLRTGDGSVGIDRVSGDIDARTGDGSIRVERADGRLDVETSDGSITLDAKPSTLRAKSGDGSIRIQLAPDTVMTGNWDIETSDGSVTVTLPSSFNAEIDAETSDGSVRTSHPGIPSESSDGDERRERRKELRTRVGEGGHLLKIRTGDGTVRIES